VLGLISCGSKFTEKNELFLITVIYFQNIIKDKSSKNIKAVKPSNLSLMAVTMALEKMQTRVVEECNTLHF